jgi:20S proteasome alpha/beta subunit
MTVIAYSSRHRVMAADSRCVDGLEYHLTMCQKVFRLKTGALLGLAGDADARDIVAILERTTPSRLPSRARLSELQCAVSALLVFPGGRVFRVTVAHVGQINTWQAEVIEISEPVVAIGSGAAYAYGALDHGASPAEAVQAACRRDVYCALPVQTQKLGSR